MPDTILSRCLTLPLISPNETTISPEENELLGLLEKIEPAGGVHQAYRLAQGFQQLLGKIREEIQAENATALKREEARYKNTTDGRWLDNREDHYKALGESLYLQRRANLLEALLLWWADILRASSGVATRALPTAKTTTAALAARLTTPEILQRIRRLEELRDHLGRNVQEALALEVAFLNVFRF